MKRFSLFVIAFLSLVSCQNDEAETVLNNEPADIVFETLKHSSFGTYTINAVTPQNFVINSQANWAAFTDLYYEPIDDINVDYSQSTVISCVGNFRPNMGQSDQFTITGVVQQNDTVHVTIQSVYGVDEIQMTMSYQPYHIVKIPKTTLPVTFNYVP